MAISAPPTSSKAFRAPRVLLVDDDPLVLRALRRQLLGARPIWEIELAESVEAAMRLLETRIYDVVVTDLHMPVLDGIALLRRLKKEQPSLMRVVHSSHIESMTAEQADEFAHAVLAKPGRPDELVLILDWAIDQRRRRLRDSVGY
jgi:DNA-binding NtrC family response regulator